MDYGGSAASGGGSVGNPQTVTNLKAGYGPSGFNQQHRFVGSATYELPFGPGKPMLHNGLASQIVGGWEVDGIVTFASGFPFTVFLNSGVNFGAPSWPDHIAPGNAPQSSAIPLVRHERLRRASSEYLWELGARRSERSGNSQLGPFRPAEVQASREPQLELPHGCIQRIQHA